jgi:hypothetical protein
MPILIEQTNEEILAAASVHRNASLKELRLRSSTLDCCTDLDQITGSLLDTDISFSPSAARVEQAILRLSIDFTFRIVKRALDDDSPEENFLTVACKFEADYGLREGHSPSEAEISSFHRGNAVFNCWPYFREYIHSSVVRMGFPPPPVPFLRLQPKPDAVQVQAPPQSPRRRPVKRQKRA